MVRSAFALLFSTSASAALGLVFWIAAGRLFPTTVVGQASAGVSAIMLLGGLARLGVTPALIRFVPIVGAAAGRFVRNSYAASAVLALIMAVIFLVLGLGQPFLGSGPIWTLGFYAAVVATCYSALQDGVLTAIRRTSWVPVENVAVALGRLALLPVLVATAWFNPVLIVWVGPLLLVMFVLNGAIFARMLPRYVREHAGRVRMPSRKDLTQFIGVEYLNGLFSNLSSYLPPVLVTFVLGPEANAITYVPWVIAGAVNGLLWNVATSFVVESTRDAANTRTYLRHATRMGLLISGAATVVMVAGAPLLLGLLGSDYSSGGTNALRLIGLATLPTLVTTFYVASLMIERNTWAIFRLSFMAWLLWLPCLVGGLYALGITGAGAGFFVSETIVALCLLPTSIRRYRKLLNRQIDDDVTMVIDYKALRAELAAEDAAAAEALATLPGVHIDDDRTTAVLDLRVLRAALALDEAPTAARARATSGTTPAMATTAGVATAASAPAGAVPAGVGAVAPEQRAGGGDDPTDVIDVRPVRSDLADLARSLERDRPHPVAATGAAHPRDAGAHLAALVPGPGGSAGPPGDPAADPTAVLNFKTLRAGLALLEKGEAVAHTGHRPGQRARGVAAVPIMDPGQVVGSVQMVFVPDDADEGEDGAGGDEETRDFGWFR